MRHNLSAVKKLIDMGSTHAQTHSDLGGRQCLGAINDEKIGTLLDAATHAEQDIAQLGCGGLSELSECCELVDGYVRGLNGLHGGYSQVSQVT